MVHSKDDMSYNSPAGRNVSFSDIQNTYKCNNNSSIVPDVDNGGAELNVVGEGQAAFLRTFSAAHRGLNPTIGMAFLHYKGNKLFIF
jgi:hypothetical protein